jgi:hypothetical protein
MRLVDFANIWIFSAACLAVWWVIALVVVPRFRWLIQETDQTKVSWLDIAIILSLLTWPIFILLIVIAISQFQWGEFWTILIFGSGWQAFGNICGIYILPFIISQIIYLIIYDPSFTFKDKTTVLRTRLYAWEEVATVILTEIALLMGMAAFNTVTPHFINISIISLAFVQLLPLLFYPIRYLLNIAAPGRLTEMEESPLRAEIEAVMAAAGWRRKRPIWLQPFVTPEGASVTLEEMAEHLWRWQATLDLHKPTLPLPAIQRAAPEAITAIFAFRYAGAAWTRRAFFWGLFSGLAAAGLLAFSLLVPYWATWIMKGAGICFGTMLLMFFLGALESGIRGVSSQARFGAEVWMSADSQAKRTSLDYFGALARWHRAIWPNMDNEALIKLLLTQRRGLQEFTPGSLETTFGSSMVKFINEIGRERVAEAMREALARESSASSSVKKEAPSGLPVAADGRLSV